MLWFCIFSRQFGNDRKNERGSSQAGNRFGLFRAKNYLHKPKSIEGSLLGWVMTCQLAHHFFAF